MLGFKKGQNKELCGSMPLHYPADRVYLDGDTSKNVQDFADDITTKHTETFNSASADGNTMLGYGNGKYIGTGKKLIGINAYDNLGYPMIAGYNPSSGYIAFTRKDANNSPYTFEYYEIP